MPGFRPVAESLAALDKVAEEQGRMKPAASTGDLASLTPTTDAGDSFGSCQSSDDELERLEQDPDGAGELRRPDPPLEAVQAEGTQSRWSAVIGAAVVVFMLLNISMGTMIKWLYMYGQICSADGFTCVAYTFPFMVTAEHMLLSWVVCAVIVRRREIAGVSLGFRQQLLKIAPVALVFSISIAFGNLSLKFIFPSFGQMLASMGPLVTVFMAILMRGARYNCWTWGSMPLICGGLLMCSVDEVNYNVKGVLCVLVATTLRSVKTVMQEALLDPSEKMDSILLLYYLAPWAGGCLTVLSLVFEGLEPFTLMLPGTGNTGVGNVLFLLALSGFNACLMNISGNMVTEYLGAVMHSILGNVKSCLGIAISCAILGNQVTSIQMFGILVSLSGTYVYQKKGGKAAVPATVGGHTAVPQDLEAADADDEAEACLPTRVGSSMVL